MKAIEPFAFILSGLDSMSLPERVEACGRICYKSEDRITPESALPFVKNVVECGHNSVLEMGVVTLEVDCGSWDYFDLLETIPKYLQLSNVTPSEGMSSGADRVRLLITGSIRAWRDMLINHQDCAVVSAACAMLSKRHPYFFDSIELHCKLIMSSVNIRKVPLEEIERLPVDNLAKHRHVAVKLVVNRAVTHELVRHRPCAFLQESQRYCRYSDDKFGSEVTFIKPMFWAEDSTEYAAWRQAMEETERLYLRLLETSTAQAARTVLPNSCKTEIIVYANLEQWRHIFKLRCSKAAEPSMREVMVPLRGQFAAEWPAIFAS